jgi:hypothetical protein
MKQPFIGMVLATLVSLAGATSTTLFKPVPQGETELGFDFAYLYASSYYDSAGSSHDFRNDASIAGGQFAIKLAFGVADGFELNASIPYLRAEVEVGDESKSTSGLGKPSIGLKAGGAVAGFLELALPVGDEEAIGEDPTLNTSFGVIVDIQTGSLLLRGALLYLWVPENDSKMDVGDVLSLHLRPGVELTSDWVLESMLEYSTKGQNAYDGENIDGSEANSFMVGPGLYYQPNSTTKLELLVPFTLSGENVYDYAGLSLTLSTCF